MRIVTTNRDGLLRHLAGKQAVSLPSVDSTVSHSVDLEPGQIAMLWESECRVTDDLPEIVVAADSELRQLLAWTSTYLDGFRPFTSLCRVMEASTFQMIRHLDQPQNFRVVRSACAAVVLADALTQGAGKVDESSVTIAACESTYSFARARAVSLGIRPHDNALEKKWTLARELGRQPRRTLMPESTEAIWMICEDLSQHSDAGIASLDFNLAGICALYARHGTLPLDYLDHFSPSSRLHVSDIAIAMSESREQRVKVLEGFLRGPFAQSLPRHESDCVRGYIASLLSPGSLEYLALISSYLDRYPTLLMWYAFFAGLHPESKVLSQFGGLCRRLLKDIEQCDSVFDRPRCDISVDELEVLSSTGPRGLTYIRAGSPLTARVELFPKIVAPVRLAVEGDEQMSLFEAAVRREAKAEKSPSVAATDLSAKLSAAMTIIESVSRQLRGGDDDRDDKRKKRRR